MTIEPSDWQKYNTPYLEANELHRGGCAIKDCRQPSSNSLPLCDQHSWDVYAIMADRVVTDEEDKKRKAEAIISHQYWLRRREDLAAEKFAATQSPSYRSQPGTIYYLQIEGLVKIGFTGDLGQRLQAYPPMSKLLATHPGTYQTEAAMHAKFAHHLAGRKEWFRECNEITDHIQEVRRTFKQDRRVAS